MPADGGLMFPDHLTYRGYSAPVRIEADVYDLEVIGPVATIRFPLRLHQGFHGTWVAA